MLSSVTSWWSILIIMIKDTIKCDVQEESTEVEEVLQSHMVQQRVPKTTPNPEVYEDKL